MQEEEAARSKAGHARFGMADQDGTSLPDQNEKWQREKKERIIHPNQKVVAHTPEWRYPDMLHGMQRVVAHTPECKVKHATSEIHGSQPCLSEQPGYTITVDADFLEGLRG